MAESSVSRCVAVAAHGKRCQQTPFRGSPYCWHHTQSRKIPAPSRPRAVAPPRPAAAHAAPPPSRPRVAPMPAPPPAVDNLGAIVASLAHRMEPADFAEVVHFLTNVETGSLLLVKQSGDLVDVKLERVRRPRQRPRRIEGASG
jgi:hypothetical protein